jgi:hypothetical protein
MYSPSITLSYYATWFPPITPKYQTNWRILREPCNSQKLFLSDILPAHLTRAIYIDADTIFFISPHLLWNEFDLFQEKHVLGFNGYRNSRPNTIWQYDVGRVICWMLDVYGIVLSRQQWNTINQHELDAKCKRDASKSRNLIKRANNTTKSTCHRHTTLMEHIN